jgi:hypothetical protein
VQGDCFKPIHIKGGNGPGSVGIGDSLETCVVQVPRCIPVSVCGNLIADSTVNHHGGLGENFPTVGPRGQAVGVDGFAIKDAIDDPTESDGAL